MISTEPRPCHSPRPDAPPANSPGRSLAAVALVGMGTLILYAIAGCQNRAPDPPRTAIGNYVRGVIAYQKGSTDQAIEALQKAVSVNHELTMARDLLGDLYQDRQEWDKAAEQYQALCELDPYTPSNFYKLGLMDQLLHRVSEAINSYLQAIKLKPDDFLSHMNLGMCYLEVKQAGEAVKYAKRATELNPKSAQAWANLGFALDSLPRGPVATAQQDEAERAYRQSLEMDSDQPRVMMYLAENLMHQQKFREARSLMLEAVKKENSPRSHKLLGDTMFLERQFDNALREYGLSLKINPSYFPALNEVGWVLMTEYHETKDLDEKKKSLALAYWKRSLEINPSQPKIQDLLKQYSGNTLFGE